MVLGSRKRRDGYDSANVPEGFDDGSAKADPVSSGGVFSEFSGERSSGELEGEFVGAGGSAQVVFWVPPKFDDEGIQATSGIGVDGKEYPDPVPAVVDSGLRPPVDILREIDKMIRSQALRDRAFAEGFDSPEEAMDLDVDGEEPWPESAYEENFWPERQAPPGPVTPGGGDKSPPQTASPPPSSSADNLKDDGGPGAKPPAADA